MYFDSGSVAQKTDGRTCTLSRGVAWHGLDRAIDRAIDGAIDRAIDGAIDRAIAPDFVGVSFYFCVLDLAMRIRTAWEPV